MVLKFIYDFAQFSFVFLLDVVFLFLLICFSCLPISQQFLVLLHQIIYLSYLFCTLMQNSVIFIPCSPSLHNLYPLNPHVDPLPHISPESPCRPSSSCIPLTPMLNLLFMYPLNPHADPPTHVSPKPPC